MIVGSTVGEGGMARSSLEDGIAAERQAHARALGEALEKILGHLRAKPEVRKILLFGSYAVGRHDLLTDLDIIVVMESTEGFIERTGRIYQELPRVAVDLDLLVYTPDEFERMKERSFVRDALEKGRLLLAR